ncbi:MULTISPECIES: hypothetical protein [Aeromonas]|uniref:Uncharacterized protein n=1 Tax=Aeromonas caviae TaxID=648 RepID=A0AAW9F1G4_AERCA|nr:MULTISPECIES: hypothetical protein [Aeromonas]MBL0558837.1 hypothetical protein [Aeromonas caviae]MBP4058960.1 hypothetical protein [Aeromonas sp. Prich7-2]MCO4204385.1 hypothetical protein [Aeromonas taiwanensis]MDH0359067.1 hypothetical protein [Aeromonas caviae]MDH0434817.1 hypothetical protein [Aeromonas caviae]
METSILLATSGWGAEAQPTIPSATSSSIRWRNPLSPQKRVKLVKMQPDRAIYKATAPDYIQEFYRGKRKSQSNSHFCKEMLCLAQFM